MNITRHDSGDLTELLQIQLIESDYIASVEKQLTDYRKKATMPGFRPGHVPASYVKKMYGKAVMADEINKLVSDSLNNYLVDNKLRILGHPLPNMEKTTAIDFDTQKEFDFYFDLAFSPEIDLQLSDKIEIPYYSIKVNDSEIDKAINDLKVRFGTEENPENAELTDGLQGSFELLDKDGKLVEGTEKHSAFFRIEDVKIKGIQDQFIGSKIGSTIDFNLLKAFENEAKVRSLLHLHENEENDLNNDYRFFVESVVRTHEAEIGVELFKKVYPTDDIKTEAVFREKIALEIKNHFQRDADHQFLSDSINELIRLANLKLPDEFMKRWLVEANEGKITFEQIEQEYERYGKTFRWQLIEGKLQEEFGNAITVDNEEVREKVRSYFTTMGGPANNPQVEGIIDTVLKNQDEHHRIQHDLLDEKLIILFKDKLKLIGKEVDQEEFYKIVSNTK